MAGLVVLSIAGCSVNGKEDSSTKQVVHWVSGKVSKGNFLKLEVVQHQGDSVLLDTREKIPLYIEYSKVAMPPVAFRAYTGVKTGDSVGYVMDEASAFGPEAKEHKLTGEKVVTRAKVLGVLRDLESVKADRSRYPRRR